MNRFRVQQDLSNTFADCRSSRFTCDGERDVLFLQILGEKSDLGGLATTFDAFEADESSARHRIRNLNPAQSIAAMASGVAATVDRRDVSLNENGAGSGPTIVSLNLPRIVVPAPPRREGYLP